MTEKQAKKAVIKMKEFTEVLKSSPRKSKEFLISAGISTQKGNLKKQYK